MNEIMGSTEAHQKLVKDFMKEVPKHFPELFVLPITNGLFRAFDDPERIIHSGIPGVLDIIIFGDGFYLFFDGKTGGATFSAKQKLFVKRMLDVNDGLIVCHKLKSIEQGIEVIREAVMREAIKWH